MKEGKKDDTRSKDLLQVENSPQNKTKLNHLLYNEHQVEISTQIARNTRKRRKVISHIEKKNNSYQVLLTQFMKLFHN